MVTPGPRPGCLGRKPAGGFTLIEILIVVVILGILAAIVIPELSSASRQAREGVLKDDLRFMREQITRYLIQHDDDPPGYPGGGDTSAVPSEANFIDQMTRHTDILGNSNATSTNVYRYGPYLTRIPDNPLNSRNGVLVVPNGSPIPAPDLNQPYGWIYQPPDAEVPAQQPRDGPGRSSVLELLGPG